MSITRVTSLFTAFIYISPLTQSIHLMFYALKAIYIHIQYLPSVPYNKRLRRLIVRSTLIVSHKLFISRYFHTLKLTEAFLRSKIKLRSMSSMCIFLTSYYVISINNLISTNYIINIFNKFIIRIIHHDSSFNFSLHLISACLDENCFLPLNTLSQAMWKRPEK